MWLGRSDRAGTPKGGEASRVEASAQVDSSTKETAITVTPGLVPVTAAKSASNLGDPEEPILRFSEWVQHYLEADEPTRRSLIAEGAALAKGHREAMKSLIAVDPRRAIELAVPMVGRQQLPKELVATLEERISGVGELEVLAVSPDSDPSEPVIRRFARLGDREWRAYVYGRRSGEMSKASTMMNGIAVDRVMAIDESPVRPLELGEIPASGKELIEKCPVSGLSTEVEKEPGETMPPVTTETPAIEAGDQIIFLCDGGHIKQLVAEILAGEGSTGGPTTPTGALPLTRKNSTGLRRHLYMRVIFPDRLDEFQTDAEAWVACRQLDEYFKEISFGKLAFQGMVTPTLVLPRTEAWYKDDYNTTGSNSPIMNDAKDAARQLGYSPEDYHHFVVIYANGPGSFGGLGSVNGTNTWLRSTSIGTFRHEIGHNIGVWHSNFWNTGGESVIGPGVNLEYGHTNDVMGSSGSAGHFNASMKQQLEWITPQTYHSVNGSGLYRIHQFDQVSQDPGLRYALRVANDADRDYWLEFRQKLTTNPWFTNGISINWSPWGSGGDTSNSGSNSGPQLLDMHPGSADDRNDSPLVIGRTYSDYEADIHITPVGKGGTMPESIDVQVNVGTAAGNNPPDLTIQTSATSIATGGSVTFTAQASDPNGDTLAYHWSFGDKLTSFNGPSFSTNNNAVQTKTFSAAGWYAVQCTASDMKGGAVRKTVLIQVGTPATFYLSGLVTDGSGNPVYDARVHNSLATGSYRGGQTDSEGRYYITNLSAGSVTLAASAPGRVLTPSGFTNPVTVGPNQTDKHFSSTDGPRVRMEPVSLTAAEGGAGASWRFVRTGDASADLSVYTDFSGSATTADYTLSPAANTATSPFELFTIPAGQSELLVNLAAVQDTAQEGTENVVVSLVSGGDTFSAEGPQTLVIPINDDDTTKSRVSLTAIDDEAAESASADTATFLVSRTGSTAASLTVNFTLDTVTPANAAAPYALSGTDFSSIGTSVVIPAGQASVPVVINPVDDTLAEGMEIVRMTVSSNAAYILDSLTQATVKINDNDQPTVTLTVTDATATEGGGAARFTIVRDGSLASALTVHYSTGGDALHGTDYNALPGFVTFGPGQSSLSIDILPIDDTRGEPSQSVVVQLRSGAAYRIAGTGNASVTIVDNGDLPAVSVFAMDGDVAEPGDTGQFRIATNGTGTGNITVNYQISGTAQSGSDFTALPGSVTMSKNTTANLTVTVTNDSIPEDAETVVLTLQPGSGYQIDPAGSAQVVISDDDSINMVSVSANTLSTTEGGTVNLYFSRSGSTTSNLSVPYTLGGAAQAGSDYTAMSGVAVIPAGAMGVYVPVDTINDTEAEGVETLVVNIAPDGGNPRTYGIEVSGLVIRVSDNDSGFTNNFSFSQTKHVFSEGDGTVSIPVSRAGSGLSSTSCSVEYTVRYSIAEGAGIDYRLTGGRLDFLPGESNKGIPIQLTDDAIAESVEALVVQLRNPTGATVVTSASLATVVVLDNEPRAFIEALDPFADETGDTGSFRISREGSTSAAMVVPLVVTGDAVAGTDFVALPQSVTIPAGSAATTLTLTPVANPAARSPVDVVVSLDVPGEDTAQPRRRASVRIGDAQTDHAPFVHLFSPTGEGQGIATGSVLRLVAAAYDDTVSGMTTTWTRISGPGPVTFGDASSPVTDASFSTAGSYLLRMSATDGSAVSNLDVTVTVGGAVSPWTESNIGSLTFGGVAISQRGVTVLSSSGGNFTGTSDSLFLRHRPLQGDGEIIARVRTLFKPSDSARVGVMVRESTATNGRFSGMLMAPSPSYGSSANRSSSFRRTTSGGSLASLETDGPTPAWWVRVTRAGNVFTTYDSPDGSNWTRRNQDTVAMATSTLAGIGVTSGITSDVVLAQVDRVQMVGGLQNIGPQVDIAPVSGMATSGVPFNLSATVSDDGYPEDPGITSVAWSFVSGPQTPVFENPSLANTLVTFPESGVYRLRLEANDGGVRTSDVVDVEAGASAATVTLSLLNQGYNGSSRSVAVTTNPPDLTVEVTYDGSSTPPINAGSYAVQATVVDPNYSGSASGTLVVSKAVQSIAFGPILNQILSATLPLSATGGSSGNPVTFAVTQGPAVISGGNQATFTATGTVTITASQAGGPNHLAAPDVPVSFTVQKNPATITLTPASLSQTYSGSPRTVAYSTNPSGLNATLTYNGSGIAPVNAGTYTVVATISDSAYQGSTTGSLEVAKLPQAISFTPLPDRFFTQTLALSATGGASGQPVLFEVTEGPATLGGGNVLTFSGTGRVTVRATQAGSTNYDPAPAVSQSFQVNRFPATLMLSGLNQVYDGTPRSVLVTTTPAGLNHGILYDGLPDAPVEPGSYTVIATVDEVNYEGDTTATLVVSKAPQTITFPAPPDPDALQTVTLSATGGPSGNPVTFELVGGPGVLTAGNQLSFTASGPVTVRARQAGNARYLEATPVELTLTVSKAPATVDLSGLTHTYDGTVKAPLATTTPTGLAVTFTYNGGSAPAVDAGDYAVVCTIEDPRYEGSDTDTLSIAKATQAIDFAALPDSLATAVLPLSATGGGSGNPVTFAVTGGPGNLQGGNQLHFTGAGTVTVTASQVGDVNHLDAPAVSRSLTVSKAPAGSLQLTRLHQVFDGSPREALAVTEPPGLAVTFTYAGSADVPTGTGTYAVMATIDDSVYEGTTSGQLVVDDPFRIDAVAGGTLPAGSVLGAQTVSGFEFSPYEVTGWVWNVVRTWANANGYDLGTTGDACAPDHPLQGIDWFDAVKWCNARTEWENATRGRSIEPAYRVAGAIYRSGEPASADEVICHPGTSGYRLPFATEREFVVRGGVSPEGTNYPGSHDATQVAWFADNTAGATCNLLGGRGTRPAGWLLPNALGFYDLSGNVAEWGNDLVGILPGDRQVGGGSWDAVEAGLRSDVLVGIDPSTRDARQGLRVARSLSQALAEGVDRTDLTWTSGGAEPWIVESGVNGAGSDAASGEIPAVAAENWIETSAAGPANLSFQWRIASGAGAAKLILSVDGSPRAEITGDTAFVAGSVYLPAGSHTIRWTVAGLAAVAPIAGRNAAWLDQVVVTPATLPLVEVSSISGVGETTATLEGLVSDDGGSPVTARGFRITPSVGGMVDIPASEGGSGAFSVSFDSLLSGTTYRVSAYATNEVGTQESDEAIFTTDEIVTFDDGLADRDRFIDSGDRQSFRFTLQDARRVLLASTGSAGLRAELYDGQGQLIASFEGAPDFLIDELLLAGDYELRVVRGADGGAPASYSVGFDATELAESLPDVSVGSVPGAPIGKGILDGGLGQRALIVSPQARAVVGYAEVANAGILPDRMSVYAARGNGTFPVAYLGSVGNITAALNLGTHQTPELVTGGEPERIRAFVTPNKRLLVKKVKGRQVTLKKNLFLLIRATSTLQPANTDSATIQVRTQ